MQLHIEIYDNEPKDLSKKIREAYHDYYGTKSGDKTSIRSPKQVYNYLVDELGDRNTERFMILCLNNSNMIENIIEISHGHLTASLVHPREVFRAAVLHSAASVILVHNHPTGNPKPSPDDIEITRKLRQAGEIMDIPIRDHVVITNDNYISFVNRGIL